MVVEKSAAPPKPKPIDIEEAIREVIFEPNEGPQTDFLASTEQEVLYGGSAGGGKSYACLLYTSPSPRDGLLSRMPSSA